MWFKRYILFRDVRHPEEMAEAESNALSTHLADRRRAGASTRKQALSDLLCLYRYLIGRPVGDPGEVSRARRPVRACRWWWVARICSHVLNRGPSAVRSPLDPKGPHYADSHNTRK